MGKMTHLEVEAHLAESRVAHLVTLRPNGRPHVAPVWFDWDGARAVTMAGDDAVRVRNIGRNPAVALSIANEDRPYRYVVLEGDARVTREDLVEVITRICIHYDGPEQGPVFARELLSEENQVLIEISVDRVVSWSDPE